MGELSLVFCVFFETGLEKREQTGYITGVNTKVTR